MSDKDNSLPSPDDETKTPPEQTPKANDQLEETVPGGGAPDNSLAPQPPTEDATRVTPDGILSPLKPLQIPGYDIKERIGSGGMAVVHKAWQRSLKRDVALKLIHANLATETYRLRFQREAEAAASITHQNVVKVYDCNGSLATPYIAMELLEGGSLAERLQSDITGGKEQNSGVRIEPMAAAKLVATVADGVQAAHDRGVIHRDLKPGNILFPIRDSLDNPKVADFGLAKLEEGVQNLTQAGDPMGTPAYMAPEQAHGNKPVGKPADIHALGVILYECITGTSPFRQEGHDFLTVLRRVQHDDRELLRKHLRGTPNDLVEICLKCIAKDENDRYASAAELAADLRRFILGDRILGPRTGVGSRIQKTIKRHGRRVIAIVAIVLLVAFGAWALKFVSEHEVNKLRREEVMRRVESLLRTEPVPDRLSPQQITVLPELPDPDLSGISVLKDDRTVDLRGWRQIDPNVPNEESYVVYNTTWQMQKVTLKDEVRIEARTSGRDVVMRLFQPNPERTKYYAATKPGMVGKETMKVRQVAIDLQNIAVNAEFPLQITSTYWNSHQNPNELWQGAVGYEGSLKISFLLLFPKDRPFRDFQLKIAPTKESDPTPYDGPRITITGDGNSWLYWEIPKPKAKHVYRVDWKW